MFENVNADKLRLVLKLFGYKNVAKIKKEEALVIVNDLYKNKDAINEILKLMDLKAFKILKSLVNNNNSYKYTQWKSEYSFICNYLLADRSSENCICLEKEIYEKIKMFNLNDYQQTAIVNQELKMLCKIMVDTYGIVKVDDVIARLNEKFKDIAYVDDEHINKLLKTEFNNIEMKSYKKVKYLYKNYIDAQWFKEISDRHEMIERKVISYKELISYQDVRNVTNNQSQLLYKIFIQFMNAQQARSLEEFVVDHLRVGYYNDVVQKILEEIIKYVPIRSEKDIKMFVDIIFKIYSDTIIWDNNGYSPIALRNKRNEN